MERGKDTETPTEVQRQNHGEPHRVENILRSPNRDGSCRRNPSQRGKRDSRYKHTKLETMREGGTERHRGMRKPVFWAGFPRVQGHGLAGKGGKKDTKKDQCQMEGGGVTR
jgi:hypothetical protein